MAGFYTHHFSVSTALCDGGAYLRRRFTFAASKVGRLLAYYTYVMLLVESARTSVRRD